MKYWRGFLVAFIFAAIAWALVSFAQAHTVLVDMVYPYMTRLVLSSLADWSANIGFCIWNVFVLIFIVGLLVSIMLMIILRWNLVQWMGWVTAVIFGVGMFNTVLFGLNDYTGPLADDVRLEMTHYTVSELNKVTIYFRDKANELATQVPRDSDNNLQFDSFETLAAQAGEGFQVLTYDHAISIFAGSTAPAKPLNASSKELSKTIPLTGEVLVNPNIHDVALPFVMCMEMSRRMTIAKENDAKFAAFLACLANTSPQFQYSAYCMAYYYCHDALASIPTGTAQACAAQTHNGVNSLMLKDLTGCLEVFGKPDYSYEENADVADMLASWYIQEFVSPLNREDAKPFDPKDPTQVDLIYRDPAYTPLPENS